MRRGLAYIALGVLLILVGALFLLQTIGVLPEFGNLIWAILPAVGGLAFLWVFIANREQWWALIPGFILLGLAATIVVAEVSGALAGAVFLGSIGLSFWAIYLTQRANWWAIIPGGTLVTLALVAGLAETLPGLQMGGVFFLGLAATFLLLYLLPSPEGHMNWPLIPAAVSAVIGAALIASMGRLINLIAIVGSLALIIFGGYLLLRSFRGQKG